MEFFAKRFWAIFQLRFIPKGLYSRICKKEATWGAESLLKILPLCTDAYELRGAVRVSAEHICKVMDLFCHMLAWHADNL